MTMPAAPAAPTRRPVLSLPTLPTVTPAMGEAHAWPTMAQVQAALDAGQPLIVNVGMGVESGRQVIAWLDAPETCPVPLDRLIVVTAMLGSESDRTVQVMTDHVLPRLRARGVRYVQLARAGASLTDGYLVLDDSRAPAYLYARLEDLAAVGAYTLEQELLDAGTIVTTAGGHSCADKHKSEVIQKWLRDTLGDAPFVQVLGYNSEETARAEADTLATAKGPFAGQRTGYFPLIHAGVTRAQCVADLEAWTGEIDWPRSACNFCPYSSGRAEVLARHRAEPHHAARALLIEYVARALNPNMRLFKTKALHDLLAADGNVAALAAFRARLDTTAWTVYRVRRAWLCLARPGKAGAAPGTKAAQPTYQQIAKRDLAAMPVAADGRTAGSYAEARSALARLAHAHGAALDTDGSYPAAIDPTRVTVRPAPAPDAVGHHAQEVYVLAPATVHDKTNPHGFYAWWHTATGEVLDADLQPDLFAALAA